MAHENQERYSSLVDKKLRDVLVKKDGVIFNTRFEGKPTSGSVKVPVRATEVTVGDYNKATGVDATVGATTYLTIMIDKDKSINEIIDGFDAASVPDDLVADRLDSAAYSLALQIEKDASVALESGATVLTSRVALTNTTIYDALVDARTALSKANVPNDKKRFLLVSPETYALVLKSPEFKDASNLTDEIKQTGALGSIAGFNLYEDTTLSATTEFIAGHPDWCSRVPEWAVPVKIQDINGSGKYIGASAVQGRMVYAHKVTNKKTLLLKTTKA